MATPAQSLTRQHARATEQAAAYFRDLAKSGELPLTPADLEAAVKKFQTELKRSEKATNAFLAAYLKDEPLPQSYFEAWASVETMYRWRMLPADQAPLVTETLNGKVCIKPTEFFRALKLHGRAKA